VDKKELEESVDIPQHLGAKLGEEDELLGEVGSQCTHVVWEELIEELLVEGEQHTLHGKKRREGLMEDL